MAGTPHPSTRPPEAHLPPRVAQILQRLLAVASDLLEQEIVRVLADYEQQVFQCAEQARNPPAQLRWQEVLRSLRRARPDVAPAFLADLHPRVMGIRENKPPPPPAPAARPKLSLLEHDEADEVGVLLEVGTRLEMRHSLPLYLMGQRFGVLAGKPGFDAESLPIGPQSLCRMLRDASQCLEVAGEHRVLLYRVFEKAMLERYGHMLALLTEVLVDEGVLPHMQHVPVRPGNPTTSPPARTAASPRTGATDANPGRGSIAASTTNMQGGAAVPSGWWIPGGRHAGGTSPEIGPSTAPARFEEFSALLARKRAAVGRMAGQHEAMPGVAPTIVDSATVQRALQYLQSRQAAADGPASGGVDLAGLRRDLLAQIGSYKADQPALALSRQDSDSLDLASMLFDEILKDVRPDSPAARLLAKLQVPLLRVALQDHHFFDDASHPARRMMDTVTEAGLYWLTDNNADGTLSKSLEGAVERALREFNGDPALFRALLEDMGSELQTMARKAELAERRHVEAARGREKLTLAREQATAAMASVLGDKPLLRFSRTLLEQAWTDVMALTALRRGEDSSLWRQQLAIANRLVDLAQPGAEPPSDAPDLQAEVAQALREVGYHGEEAEAIAKRLVIPTGTADETQSRTELMMRVKAGSRFAPVLKRRSSATESLPASVAARVEEIRKLPFGTWFEFVVNAQGDRVRRRLSWFSPVTGNVLFVNHLGQKLAETHLEELAAQVDRQQAFIVTDLRVGPVDRAWSNVTRVLDAFGSGDGRT